MKEVLLKHYSMRPLMRVDDFVKLIFQACKGCEHALGELNPTIKRLEEEASCCDKDCDAVKVFEQLSDVYGRVNIFPYLNGGGDLRLLAEIFHCSAQHPVNGKDFQEEIEEFVSLCEAKRIDLPYYSVKKFLLQYDVQHPKAVSHSMTYRINYAPHYRVVRKDLFDLLPLIGQLNSMMNSASVTMAIEGGSGCGKSFYAQALSDFYGSRCTVVHTDDFFLPPQMRTQERLDQVGGNVHYELLVPLVKSLRKGERAQYEAYDCQTGEFTTKQTAITQLNIVEGVYSCHPTLLPYYDCVLKLNCSEHVRQKRIMNRNGIVGWEKFRDVWIPLEDKYYDSLDLSQTKTFNLTTD